MGEKKIGTGNIGEQLEPGGAQPGASGLAAAPGPGSDQISSGKELNLPYPPQGHSEC